ncbi:L-threonine ammonia-lyase [Breznakibacter xylanolyticus]|uniref:L-threonine dehydratase n=1 Tax=Breznakibacter xylanolyticus TaxID=990 RepID=A0A2W7PW59_9BACT|nr:threonine ammonia-lyase IlvA [Breznakibacter xylanolyticus]PZX13829.1 L-threonine ammonia-lyase [Breznakibacter xylanolyticus]
MLSILDIETAYQNIKEVVVQTPLVFDPILSERFQAHVYLKREDLQVVRSYKIRGAYNKISSLTADERLRGIVCASAGNHAQGVAFACRHLGIRGRIFMPATTPQQKIKQVRMFGKDQVEIILTGDTYDDAYQAAMLDCQANGTVFIHPFDDRTVIAGQGTVGLEVLRDAREKLDYLFVPVGGGGLISGVGSYFKQISPGTRIIGVEPQGAPSMQQALEQGHRVTLSHFEKFVDGAAVATVGALNFELAQEVIDDMVLVPEGKVCTTILQLYNEEAIVAEPAGALSISALDFFADAIRGKNVVCIVSGGNNDITRTEEIKERSMLYEGLKHYFIIRFPQRAGALREFLNEILGPDDEISHFEYTKKNNRENGPALVGIETKSPDDYNALISNMNERGVKYQVINENPDLFNLLI